MLYAVVKPLAALMMRLLFRLEGHGAHHVPRGGPVLLVSNHSSYLDSPLIGVVAPRPLYFLAKSELFDVPLFGRFIRRLNARPVRRDGSDPAALRAALRILSENRVLLIFPEGTRGEEGGLRRAKRGAGMLALLSGAPVVPVFVSGSGRAWPRERRWPRPSKITVMFGPPLRFEVNGGGRKERSEAASQAIMTAIARLGNTNMSEDRASGSPSSEPGKRSAVGGVGVGSAQVSPKSTHGRSGRNGEG